MNGLADLNSKQREKMERFLSCMGEVLGKKLKVSIKVISRQYNSRTGGYVETIPARTDGTNVDISPEMMDWSNPVRAWLQTKGFFYHEVMHGVADPMGGYKAKDSWGLHETLNMLGDEVGEVRFAEMYPGARSYFALNVYEVILKEIAASKGKDSVMDPRSYAVLYGRRSFLPKRLMAMARAYMRTKFSEAQVQRVERLIDDYQAAASLKTEEREPRCLGIAREFQGILGTMKNPFNELVLGGHMSKEARDTSVPEAEPVPSLDSLPAEPDEDDEPESDESDKDEGEGKGDSGDAEPERESEDAETADGEEGDGADGNEQADEEGSETDASGTGKGTEPAAVKTDAKGDEDAGGEEGLPSGLEQADLGEGYDGPKAEKEIGGHAETGGEAEWAGPKGDAMPTHGQPDPLDLVEELEAAAEKAWEREKEFQRHEAEVEVVDLGLVESEIERAESDADKLAGLLRRIQTKAASGYESEHRAGRLNLRAVRMSRGLSTQIFQQYVPDRRQATKLNIAIVMDRSGSMGGRIDDVNKVAAAICMACEKASPTLNKVMLRYFNFEDRLTKKPWESFKPTSLLTETTGGNHPGMSMFPAMDWLRTETGVKVLIILTDSGWDSQDSPCCRTGAHPDRKDKEDSIAVRERAKLEGVRVQVLHTGTAGGDLDYVRRQFELPVDVVTYENLADVVFGIVQEAMREQARKVLA